MLGFVGGGVGQHEQGRTCGSGGGGGLGGGPAVVEPDEEAGEGAGGVGEREGEMGG